MSKKSLDEGIVTRDWEHCFNPTCRKSILLERHHCLHGSRRALADSYGLVVPLCHFCHRDLHDRNTELDRYIQRCGEKAFIEKYHPYDTQAGITEFIQIFGKNYLYDTREGEFEEMAFNIPDWVDPDEIENGVTDNDTCEGCGEKLVKIAYDTPHGLFCRDCCLKEFEINL